MKSSGLIVESAKNPIATSQDADQLKKYNSPMSNNQNSIIKENTPKEV